MTSMKVLFPLVQDEDGYPPVSFESLWSSMEDNDIYKIDNIPFFAREISLGDRVLVDHQGGEAIYALVISKSMNSTYRMLFSDTDKIESTREYLRSLGCQSEQSHIPSLIAVNVPESVGVDIFVAYLNRMEDEGIFEYEEAALRGELATR